MNIRAPFPRLNRLRSRCLVAADEGVAAIEFALLAPIMLLLFVGTFELSQALTIDRRVTQVASSTADLVAREEAVTFADVEDVMRIGGHLIRPFDESRLRVTLLNVVADIDNATVTRVCWKHSHNGGTGTFQPGQQYDLPIGIVEAGNSVIVVEVTYDYQPLIFLALTGANLPLRDTFYLKPRLSSFVEYNGTKCS